MAEGSSSLSEELITTLRRSKRGKRSARVALFEDVETDSPDETEERGRRGNAPLRGGRGGRRGGGRGGGGGRVWRGRKFDAGEEERLVQLHEDRQQQANDMIDEMTEEETKAMMKEIASRQPAVILDIAELLSRRLQQEPEPDPGSASQSPSWCVCTRCPPRDRVEDQVCCGMAPQYCTSLWPEMGLMVTDPLTLHLQQTFRNDIFAQQADMLAGKHQQSV